MESTNASLHFKRLLGTEFLSDWNRHDHLLFAQQAF